METAVQPEGRAGKLTIFAGYMSGIGTAAAMLRAADRARQSGTDVVAGAAISCECPEARSFEGLWRIWPIATKKGVTKNGIRM